MMVDIVLLSLRRIWSGCFAILTRTRELNSGHEYITDVMRLFTLTCVCLSQSAYLNNPNVAINNAFYKSCASFISNILKCLFVNKDRQWITYTRHTSK
jgi:hypothetical protein